MKKVHSHLPQEQDASCLHLDFPNILQFHTFTFKSFEEADQLSCTIALFYPENNRNNIKLGLNEIFFNAIEHGNLEITFEEKAKLKESNQWHEEIQNRLRAPFYQNKNVVAQLEITPSFICLQVHDEGDGFDWNQYIGPCQISNAHHGRGLILAQELSFDKIEFSPKGNVVRCFTYIYSNQFGFNF